MQIHDEHHDDEFINPLLEVGRGYIFLRMVVLVLSAMFILLATALSLLTDLVFRYPILTGVVIGGTVVFLVGLGAALYLQERAQERRWKSAEHDGGKALFVDPSTAFVCSVCASRGGPDEECPKHPGARLDSRDDDNRYAIAQALDRQTVRRVLPIGAAIALVPIAALALVFYVVTLPCPWGTSFVDERAGLLGGETWCEDGEGLKHGAEVHYDPIGTKIAELTWEHGEQHGSEVRFYPDGVVSLEQSWQRGKLHGSSLAYHTSGRLKLESSYVDGEPDGLHMGFWPSGNKRSEAQYDKGTPIGVHTEWFERGNEASIKQYKDGVLEGTQVTYRKDGSIQEKETYVMGVLEGGHEKYNRRGDLLQRGMYKGGQKHGAWVERVEKGVYRRGSYVLGKRDGVWEEEGVDGSKRITHWRQDVPHGPHQGWHADGSPSVIGAHVDGNRDGLWLTWHPASLASARVGVPARRELASAAAATAPTTAAQLADMLDIGVDDIALPEGIGSFAEAGRYIEGKQEGAWWSWYESGWPKRQTAYVEGMQHGPYRRWARTGQLEASGAHTRSKRTGPWTEVLPAPSGAPPGPEGTWRYRGTYEDGHKVGVWQASLPDGRLVLRNEWVEGLKNGVQTTWDTFGNKLEEGPYVDGLANGTFKKWRLGELVSESGFKDGYYHGLHTEFRDGEVVSRTRWEMGEAVQ